MESTTLSLGHFSACYSLAEPGTLQREGRGRGEASEPLDQGGGKEGGLPLPANANNGGCGELSDREHCSACWLPH